MNFKDIFYTLTAFLTVFFAIPALAANEYNNQEGMDDGQGGPEGGMDDGQGGPEGEQE